ncbi:MAG: DNA translocase FtsK 4TM domain-containing protein [Candidatus Brocadia sp.]|nr:DNA translocase FtsK 4TM domain-containing protein [Candidatus Brocadia sp.]
MDNKRFFRSIGSVILIAFALFFLLSFLSYSSNDPPFADYPVNNPVHNMCGPAGAQVAGYALAGMGRTSYLIVILLGWMGTQFLYKERIEYLWVRAIGAVLLLFSLASLLTMGCYLLKKDFLSVNVGGIFGIVTVSRLYEYFSLSGTLIVLGLGLVLSVMLLFNATPISPWIKGVERKTKEERLPPVRNSEAQNPGPLRRLKEKVSAYAGITTDDTQENDTSPAAHAVEIKNDRYALRGRFGKNRETPDDKPSLDGEKRAIGKEDEEDEDRYDTVPVEKKENAYKLPPPDLLEKPDTREHGDDWDKITQRAQVLKNTLEQFNVKSEVVEIERGPVITMYEVELAPGTKVGKVVSLSDDLAIALKAPSVRVVAPLMGKSSIGIEVPNIQREMVMLRELLDASEEVRKKMSIPLLIGKDVAGNPVISDLASMPHLLIAGTTGSGKSVCLNSVILSILFLRHPHQVQLLLVDPKMVEFSLFREIPHLISPVVTDMKKASAVLEWAVNKMEERYALLASVGVKHINGYNRLGMSEIRKRLNPEGDVNLEGVPFHLPHVVIVVDELADLMMVASKEVEGSVIRLSQKSRAVGIHLILATQRPSVDVITGLIKSNLPSRISFYVASKVDSRTILDQNGAEKLLGSGDMLFLPPGTSKLVRVQGAYVSDEEVKNVVEYLRTCATPQFSPELKCWKGASDKDNSARDDLYPEAVRIILESQRGSVSLLQRRLEIGYSRAAKLIDLMAEDGIVGEYKGSQAREVFLTLEEWDAQTARMNQEEMDNV